MSEEDKEWEKLCKVRDHKHDQYKKEFEGLSCHAFNCFYSHEEMVGDYNLYGHNEYKDSDEYSTAEKVRAAIKSGKLHPQRKPRPRNYGWRTHVEVCQFLGLLNPAKEKKVKRLKQLEEEVRKLKREMIETAEEEEMQRLFNKNLMEYAAKALKLDNFKTPAPLPTLRKPE
tara:strand:- start:14641 stop:15153 length:513 start_codon:yes stop_codon:yes gene_type:complete